MSSVPADATTATFTFQTPGGTVTDTNGVGTNFTTRLANTLTASPDSRLLLDTTSIGVLNLSGTTTGQNFNGQANVGQIEAPGILLSGLGFTGSQDFSVSATFVKLQNGALFEYAQFGVYVGTSTTQMTRDGFLFSSILGGKAYFGVNTNGTADSNITGSGQPAFDGRTLIATISRTGGVFAETVNGVNVTPSLDPGLFLDGASDLTVGVYSVNTDGTKPFTASLDGFTATVAPEPGSATLLLGSLGMLAARRRRSA